MLNSLKFSHQKLIKSLLRRLPSAPLSAAAAAAPLPFTPLLPQSPSPSPSPDLDPDAIAASFKHWFRLASVPPSPLDRIYSALASAPEGPALDSALSRLHLPLSEDLVLRILRHRPHHDLLLLRLKFFDWSGRQPGYRHTRVTYHAIFRLLSRAHLTNVIIDWLHQFSSTSRRDLSTTQYSFIGTSSLPARQPRFNETLIVGYAVAGRPELALQLFAKMRFQGLDLDYFAYHVLLNSLVEADLYDLADAVLTQMAARNLTDEVTNCIRMKSLCRQGRLDEAEAYLRELMSEGRAAAEYAFNVLIRALCRKERFDVAVQLVNEFGSAGAYGVWINRLVDASKLDAAMEFLRSKKAADDHVENINYNHLINQLLAKNRLGEVYDMLVVMMEEGITPDNATMNSALCFFCKAGMVDVAIQLYKSRAELGMTPNSWAYDELIKALCYDGSVDEACLVLEEAIQQGFFVGKKSFSILANVLCHQKKIDKVWKLLDEAIQRKMRPTTKILARYLSALCKTGKVKEAFMVPHLVPGVKTSLGQYKYTYTSLIHACLMSDMPNTKTVDILPRLLIEMQEQGHSPGRSLFRKVVCRLCEEDKYGTVLDLLNKQLELKILDPVTCYNFFIEGAAYSKKTTVAKEVYDRMVAAGTDPTVATDLLLLKGYLKSSHIVDALSFFHYLLERRKPSNKLYNIFISGLCDAGKTELAMEIWREVRNRDLIPSLQCYEDLVLRLCSSKEYGSVVDVLNDFEKTGRPVSSFLCNVLLLHSLKGQDLWRAWIQSEDVRARTSREAMGSSRRMLGSLIEFFSDIRSRENLDNLDEKMEEFYPVDTFTYNMLLRSLTMVGKLDSACHLLRKMHMKGYEPNEYCFDIIVSGFCKLGSRKDADIWMEVMHRHGFTPSGFTARVYNQIS